MFEKRQSPRAPSRVLDLITIAFSHYLPGPDVFGAVLPCIDQLAPEMQSWVTANRERPAGRFAVRMFAEERPLRA